MHGTPTSMRAAILSTRVAVATALIAMMLPATAHAHSKSETTVPADGADVEAVEAIEMRFDAPMRVIRVMLSADGDEVEIERETGMEPVTEFRAVPADDLSPGAYEVEWRGMSADGHPMQGTFGFTVVE